ncbi:hypothetical protein I3842_03G113200 [Carya illinoinensis]|uniref:Uncharacterized protein n=1 Tax=Carya illinoinensis TaxID=32201 RepID=A0A922FJQ4_CARIL|nr:hypothetical protein I3842_03G113200 [Carya illinoinensis]KAG6721472.1 hypothetical protein I3842_03G113200 [Carya illinoinensis]
MNDFEDLLPTDLGFKSQGQSAPMTSSKPSFSSNFGSSHPRSSSSNSFDDRDSVFTSTGPPHRSQDFGSGYGDLFGSSRYPSKSESSAATTSFNFETFRDSGATKASATPVYDKPVYDDDIFDGVPGLKSSSSRAKYDDVFASGSASSPKGSDALDDLLAGFGKAERESKGSGVKGSEREEKGVPVGFDDLIPGFGVTNVPSERPTSEAKWSSKPTVNPTRSATNVMEDPFKILESTSRPVVSSSEHFADPLEEISKFSNSRSIKNEGASAANSGEVYDDADPFNGLGNLPAFSLERNNRVKEKSPLMTDMSTGWNRTSISKDSIEMNSVRSPESHLQKNMPVESDQYSHQTMFDMPTFSTDSHKSFGQTIPPPSYSSTNEANAQVDMSPRAEEKLESFDDVWLTVSEIPLFTQPTSAPPPSRPPPPRPVQVSNSRKKINEHTSFPNSAQYTQGPKSAPAAAKDSVKSPFDELEDFAMARSQDNVDEHANGLFNEELGMNSAAAAMKEAMDRAEAKFKHAREVRERESTKAARSKEAVQLEKDERTAQDERSVREKQERLDRDWSHGDREEEEREQRRIEKEREKEEKEKEQRRLEKERERAREIEREREKARQAVERATREARERAATGARLRAEKAAVEKANAEARERAERAAVQRAQAEARERAAAEAKERAEKAAAEARERANTEARDRAAVARAEAEARLRAERAAVERAATEARERAAAAARMNQQKNENDLESFFSMGRASSAPRPRANSSDPLFDTQSQNRQDPEVARRSATSSSNIRKVNSTTNIVDDLSSIFGAAPSSGEFQEVEGESEERRRARLERHQRAHERAAKALAEKNQRDLQTQRDQAERHRIAETLDVEIKRWAAGKEGNLRALLSTLQYVLWPESGWQPVSLTDMLTAPAVKKIYRKATLCIHPDKVQQKGATLQQKYVAEKVFDLLKEAWNKFNSEELF